MDTKSLASNANDLAELIWKTSHSPEEFYAAHAQASEFLRSFAGAQSAFYTTIISLGKSSDGLAFKAHASAKTLLAFEQYLQKGLHGALAPEERGRLDAVSDILDQANTLLETKGVHPAAPAVLIGATLEEYLRLWVEREGLTMGGGKPSIDSYCQILREKDLINKQDAKDITSWAGIRNHAAHGEWDEVSNKEKISLMLYWVNLFMRQHGKSDD